MNPRNRVFMILGLLTVGSLIWYWFTARPSSDLQLIGTVDANEVEVSSKIPGRIQTLLVEEGQQVAAGQPIAELGLGPEQRPLLHFEIRDRGKPIDPLPLLPRR